MVKIIALIKRRADLSRSEFRRHYEEIHAPLALQHLEQMSGYVRNHVAGELIGRPAGFDCLSEFWYADQAAFQCLLAYLGSDAAEPIRRDELSFMSKAENVFFPVEEQLVIEDRSAVASGAVSKIVALAARSQGEPLASFLRRYGAALPAWLEGLRRPLQCTQNIVLHSAQVKLPWDAITMLWYHTQPAEIRLLQGALPDMERFLMVRVSEHKTPLREGRPV